VYCISTLIVLYNSSKGLVILSSKPKAKGQFGKRRKFPEKRRKFPGKRKFPEKGGKFEEAAKLVARRRLSIY
jgi:hypothetical protein